MPLRVAVTLLLVVVAALAVARLDLAGSRPEEGAKRSGYGADGRWSGPPVEPTSRPNLVVLVVDTLRWDGPLPRPDGTLMPHLARLAAEGVSFSEASSTAPWTMPAVGSLLTGLLPHGHGNLDARRPPALPAAVTTYAEVLSQTLGYETIALVDAPWFGGPQAFLQGFQTTSTGFHLQGLEHDLGEWARRRKATRPFFLLLHTNEAHEPYGAANHPWPRPPFDPSAAGDVSEEGLAPWELARIAFLDLKRRDALGRKMGLKFIRQVVRYVGDGYAAEPRPDLAAEFRAAYEEGLRWVDGLIRQAVERLSALGLMENTLLVVTSDHGEGFGEHGHLGHGRQMYDELLRIPLVMRGPAPFAGGRVADGSVSLMDVMPTFLDWIGAPPVPNVDGASMLPVLRGASPGRPVVAEEALSSENMQRDVEASVASVRTAAWKYVLTHDRTAGSMSQELYDLASDPFERTNLLAGEGAKAPALPADVCKAIHAVRERAAGVAGVDSQLALTPYGPSTAGTASLDTVPAPCDDD
jgi:arylsulfatase A-like enzyme